ncbi:MAG: hypothetical protein ACKVRN_16580 [Pyrinomonadaceae bacterium]
MKKTLGSMALVSLLAAASFSQDNGAAGKKPATANKPPVAAVDNASIEIAKATLAAHGGDKLKKMKSLVVRGAVDITGAFSQVIPATFMMVIAGDRYVFELNNPIQPLKQTFDGKNTFSTGFELPPMTSLGFPLLPKIGETGYIITALPEAKKKKKGYRITTPDGFYTDFFIDEKSNQIKGYESSYDVNGRLVTTSVEIDEFQTVEGVIIPKRYSQRFDLGQMTAYANFKTKDILVNSTIADDVFALPK